MAAPAAVEGDDPILRAVGRMTHVHDAERTRVYGRLLRGGGPPVVSNRPLREQRLVQMLYFDLWGSSRARGNIDTAIADLWMRPAVRGELLALLEVLDAQADVPTHPLRDLPDTPLLVHAKYTREEVLAAMGIATASAPVTFREGVRWDEANAADLFFITLDKDASRFSKETRYKDAVLAPALIQWESQNRTSQASPTGQRYINHRNRGTRILIFLREASGDPFLFAGPASYVAHEGDRPIRFQWELAVPLPEAAFEVMRLVA